MGKLEEITRQKLAQDEANRIERERVENDARQEAGRQAALNRARKEREAQELAARRLGLAQHIIDHISSKLLEKIVDEAIPGDQLLRLKRFIPPRYFRRGHVIQDGPELACWNIVKVFQSNAGMGYDGDVYYVLRSDGSLCKFVPQATKGTKSDNKFNKRYSGAWTLEPEDLPRILAKILDTADFNFGCSWLGKYRGRDKLTLQQYLWVVTTEAFRAAYPDRGFDRAFCLTYLGYDEHTSWSARRNIGVKIGAEKK